MASMAFSAFVEKNGRPRHLAADEHVFRQGDEDRALYVLQSGLLKAYYLSDEGRETVKSFIVPGDLIGSLAAAYRNETCSFSLIALEPSTAMQLDFDALYSASQQDLGIASAVVDFLLAFAMKKEKREREFLTESAQARYRLLIEQSPDLVRKLRQQDIARYLGITPVALSRIRARGRG